MGKAGAYVSGNLALKEPFECEEEFKREKRENRGKEKAKGQLNLPYIFFLSFAAAVMVMVFIQYINIKTEYTIASREKVRLCREYDALRHENNIIYHDKIAGVDYAKLKEKAVDELGMRYPVQAQIVYYTPVHKESVVQYEEIPEEGEDR